MKLTDDVKQREQKHFKQYRTAKQKLTHKENLVRFLHRGKPHFLAVQRFLSHTKQILKRLLNDISEVVRDSQGGSESNKKIPAHKFVLAISSPVFYAMFYGELAETKDSVEITDCEYESLLELFRFIYSDEANLNPNNVMQLLYLAKKYMLPSLAPNALLSSKRIWTGQTCFTSCRRYRNTKRKICWITAGK